MPATTALIADDEPLLREQLVSHLSRLWPKLEIVAQARNGNEAVELFDRHQPQVAFLDVHMPGMNGIEAARHMGEHTSLIFITAFDRYAVEAFSLAAIDYIVKPIQEDRLAETLQRLRGRLQNAVFELRSEMDAVLDRMATQLHLQKEPQHQLKWIKASVGHVVRLIPVEKVVYLQSDSKYTSVVWEGGQALIRRSIRELADELDPNRFVQIHRSAIVNLSQVSQFSHGPGDSGEVHLKNRTERLPVSRNFMHLFHQM